MLRPYSDNPEWLEVHNTLDCPVELEGLAVDDAVQSVFGSLVVPAGGYAVLSERAFDETCGVELVAVVGDLGFDWATDNVAIGVERRTLDGVPVSRDDWRTDDHRYHSHVLDQGSLDAVSNDDAASWCRSTALACSWGDGTIQGTQVYSTTHACGGM
jgi:hypothetical protein